MSTSQRQRSTTTARALHRATVTQRVEPQPAAARGGATHGAHPFDALDLAAARMMLLRKALRHVDAAAAEDLVQATFIAAFENADSFEGRAKATTWLVGILMRKITDHYREGGRRRRLLESAAELTPVAPVDAPEALDSARHRARLLRGLDALTERERAVVLAAIDDPGRADIAARLGVTRSHLRVLWHRAAHKLRAVN